MDKVTYQRTDDYHVTFERVKHGDSHLTAVHCDVFRWTSAVKKELAGLLEFTLRYYLGGEPLYAFSDNRKLSKFIRTMGGLYCGEVETAGLGTCECFVFLSFDGEDCDG